MKFKIQKGVPVSENQVEFGVAKVIFRKKVRMLLSVLCFSFSFFSSLYDVYPSEGNIVCVNSIAACFPLCGKLRS